MVDLDEDGDRDVVIAHNSSDEVGVLLNEGDATFLPRPNPSYNVEPNATSSTVLAGDVDGDGDLDILAVDEEVCVLFNNGDGTLVPGPTVAIPVTARRATLADLDGDLDTDIWLTSSAGVRVMPNDGAGMYGPPLPVTDVNAYDILAARLDPDDDLDLAVADGLGVSVLLHNEDGTFDTAAYGDGVGRNGLVAADLDGDLDLDLVAIRAGLPGDGDALVLLNDGAGTFTPGQTTALDYPPVALDADDIDHDGDIDVVIGGRNEPNLSVLRNKGDGTFAPVIRYDPAGERVLDVVLVDVDGDDIPDLVVLNAQTTLVFPNLGDGTFAPAWRYAVGAGPASGAIGDLNDDGSTDIAVLSWIRGEVTVLLNRCASCPADVDGSGVVGFGDILAILANWGPCPPPCSEDVNGDGIVGFADILAVLATWGPCV